MIITPNAQAVRRHWDARRGAAKAPCRMRIDPGDIASQLPWVAIVEVPELLVRLSGSRVQSVIEPVRTLAAAIPDENLDLVARCLADLQTVEIVCTHWAPRLYLTLLPMTLLDASKGERALVVVDELRSPVEAPCRWLRGLRVIDGGRS